MFESAGNVPLKKEQQQNSSNISSIGKRVVIWKADNEKDKVTKVVGKVYIITIFKIME